MFLALLGKNHIFLHLTLKLTLKVTLKMTFSHQNSARNSLFNQNDTKKTYYFSTYFSFLKLMFFTF